MTRTIYGLQHPKVKEWARLRTDRSFRQEKKIVWVSGIKQVSELAVRGIAPEAIVTTEEPSIPYSCPVIFVTKPVLQKITGLLSPEPIAALVPLPEYGDVLHKNRLLVLDGIADPGNLGTLLRTAEAFGVEGVYFTGNGCDPFNDKALRAARGATFSLPLQEGSLETFFAKAGRFTVFLADLEGKAPEEVSSEEPWALIVSREAQGAREHVGRRLQRISIPMDFPAESLNVAIAGGILLHALRRQR